MRAVQCVSLQKTVVSFAELGLSGSLSPDSSVRGGPRARLRQFPYRPIRVARFPRRESFGFGAGCWGVSLDRIRKRLDEEAKRGWRGVGGLGGASLSNVLLRWSAWELCSAPFVVCSWLVWSVGSLHRSPRRRPSFELLRVADDRCGRRRVVPIVPGCVLSGSVSSHNKVN
ncbi:hypothetical protein NL676_019821 [Syzygium grande]|nr:hypothetical protein NL676_019821 [Syzygium grande]